MSTMITMVNQNQEMLFIWLTSGTQMMLAEGAMESLQVPDTPRQHAHYRHLSRSTHGTIMIMIPDPQHQTLESYRSQSHLHIRLVLPLPTYYHLLSPTHGPKAMSSSIARHH